MERDTQTSKLSFFLAVAFAALAIFAVEMFGAPTPTPAPSAISDEEIARMTWDDMILTVKRLRGIAATAIAEAANQKEEIARSITLIAEVMDAAKKAIIRLDEHDQRVADLAAENERNKEESLRKDTTIAEKNGTIFKLQAALAGLVVLILAYVALKLFTKLPI